MTKRLDRPLAPLIGLISLLALGIPGKSAFAQGTKGVESAMIEVLLDQAKLVQLPPGAETIVVGNPAIADVAVQKNGVMVITGKTTGRTNFIALDQAGSIISESVVAVTVTTAGRVVVQRGLDRASYDCAPVCSPTVSLGDEEKHFGRISEQATRRERMAQDGNGRQRPPQQ